jgi:serine/threonine-protein kinase OSR1/STK39
LHYICFWDRFVQEAIRQEVQTMSLIEHPNLLRAYCSFATGSSLWVVMPYMAGGSCRYIMQSAYPDGFEQPVIATLLYGVVKALAHLHAQGLIHRDIKVQPNPCHSALQVNLASNLSVFG